MTDFRTLRRLKLLLDAGYLDESVALLKSAGLSKAKSARALKEVGVESGEAKRLVHESPVWANVRGQDDAFLDALHQAIEELERETGRDQ